VADAALARQISAAESMTFIEIFRSRGLGHLEMWFHPVDPQWETQCATPPPALG
jgi:hypothetical protein